MLLVLNLSVTDLLYLSGRNESGTNKNKESEKAFVKTKEYVWCQNKAKHFQYLDSHCNG